MSKKQTAPATPLEPTAPKMSHSTWTFIPKENTRQSGVAGCCWEKTGIPSECPALQELQARWPVMGSGGNHSVHPSNHNSALGLPKETPKDLGSTMTILSHRDIKRWSLFLVTPSAREPGIVTSDFKEEEGAPGSV